MLNIDKTSRKNMDGFLDPNLYIEYVLEMGSKVEIEKRKVTSLPSLFGELGGLNDFFTKFIVLIIGGYQANSYVLDTI